VMALHHSVVRADRPHPVRAAQVRRADHAGTLEPLADDVTAEPLTPEELASQTPRSTSAHSE
jgi:hypothetical protein